MGPRFRGVAALQVTDIPGSALVSLALLLASLIAVWTTRGATVGSPSSW